VCKTADAVERQHRRGHRAVGDPALRIALRLRRREKHDAPEDVAIRIGSTWLWACAVADPKMELKAPVR